VRRVVIKIAWVAAGGERRITGVSQHVLAELVGVEAALAGGAAIG
jgi:hypothetical protein